MVSVRPAIVSVPVRELVLVLAAIEYATVPEPVPLAPDVIVIHDTLLDAVHAHPLVVVTVAVPVVALADADAALGVVVYVHPPAWVTVNVWPEIVSVPVRCDDVVLAATE